MVPQAILDKVPNIARAVCELQRIESGDALPHWEGLPALAQSEMLAFVEAVVSGKTPEVHHLEWLLARVREGWVVGGAYDAEAKTDPRLILWDERPASDRIALTRAARLVQSLVML